MTIAAKIVASVIATASPVNGIDPLHREMFCSGIEDVDLRTAAICIPHARFFTPNTYCLLCMRDRKQ